MRFTRERFKDCYNDARPLIIAHYEEIAWRKDKIPLHGDVEAYQKMDDAGMLICYTARKDGKLVAYASWFYHTSPHYMSTMYAVCDVIFVDPAHRGGTGSKFVDYMESQLKALGAQVLSYHIKCTFDWSPVIKRKGYEQSDTIWLKWIGD